MDIEYLSEKIESFVLGSPANHVLPEYALRDDLIGMTMFEPPITAAADAHDPLFAEWRRPEVVHPDVLLPDDWLPGAKSVITFFLPFTKEVKAANAAALLRQTAEKSAPADEWLHARIEGQAFIESLCRYICALLNEAGFAAAAPAADPRFRLFGDYTSNWSERHAAYIAGLGTFSLSKGMITKKGIAGRFGSVITDCPLPASKREYSGLYDYCLMCGRCQANCPPGAIDISKGAENGKDHTLCYPYIHDSDFVDPRSKIPTLRFGCGMCQVAVPCQDGIPKRPAQQS